MSIQKHLDKCAKYIAEYEENNFREWIRENAEEVLEEKYVQTLVEWCDDAKPVESMLIRSMTAAEKYHIFPSAWLALKSGV